MNENNVVGYRYQDATVKSAMASVYVDGYNSFGWQTEGTSNHMTK